MRVFQTLFILFWLYRGFFLPLEAQAAWERPAQPPDFQNLQSALPHPLNPEKLLVVSGHQLFEGDGKNWRPFTAAPPSLKNISRIQFFEESPQLLFLLTSTGLWTGNLERGIWTPVYQTQNSERFRILCFALSPEEPDHWFLGTSDGLLESDDAGKTWFRFSSFRNKSVALIRIFKGRLFIGTQDKLYRAADYAHFEPVFSLKSLETEESEEFTEFDFWDAHLFDLIESKQEEILWLGTEKGVFESRDDGFSWSSMPRTGFRSTEVRHLAYSPRRGKLFAGTSNGIYEYDRSKNQWNEKFEGLDHTSIRGLALLGGEEEKLIALTGSGLFQLPVSLEILQTGPENIPGDRLMLFRKLIQKEPTAREIQKAVLRYGNLTGGKIKRWHALSRAGAFLPGLSFGKGFSRDNNIDIDRAGTNDPDRFIYGPDDTGKSWDVDLNWSLKDFLYSSDQTSIDSREKLMVELRSDMLAEAMRVYFERRRLQIDLVFHPAENDEGHWGKLLRIDELTALLDGMTNGYLSRRLEQIYARNAELNQIWEFTK